MPYKLTTFFVYCSGFPWKNVLPIEMGRGGLVDGEVACSEKNKNFEIGYKWVLQTLFIA
jgi:hypothetical protein